MDRVIPDTSTSTESGCRSYPGGVCPPTSHYDIGYDEGAWNQLSRKVLGYLTDQVFAVVRWVVRAGTWVVNWALTFGFAEKLAAPARDLADVYRRSIVEPLGLGPFFLMLAAAYGGWHVFRGRATRGAGEFFVSVIIAALAATALARPDLILTNSLERTADLSGEVVAVTTEKSEPEAGKGYESLADPLTRGIHQAFVEYPHQLINWGQVLAPTKEGSSAHRCWTVYQQNMAEGPWGTDNVPRNRMRDAGCEDLYNFNHDPSADRFMAVVLVFGASLIVVVLLVLMAATLVAAQLAIVGLIVASPFAFVIGVLPKSGRQVLWRWAAAVGRALAAILMTAVFLSLFLVTINTFLEITRGDSLILQMAIIDLVAILAFVGRRRLLTAGRRAVDSLGRRSEAAGTKGNEKTSWLAPTSAAVGLRVGSDGRWRDDYRKPLPAEHSGKHARRNDIHVIEPTTVRRLAATPARGVQERLAAAADHSAQGRNERAEAVSKAIAYGAAARDGRGYKPRSTPAQAGTARPYEELVSRLGGTARPRGQSTTLSQAYENDKNPGRGREVPTREVSRGANQVVEKLRNLRRPAEPAP